MMNTKIIRVTQKPAPFKRQLPLHLMLLPSVLVLLIYSYYPMVGILIGFENFNPRIGFFGSEWTGLQNLLYVMKMPNFTSVLYNTVFIATMKIVASLAVPILYAILLDQIRNSKIKRSIQTALYIPNFLSWVILSGILIDILSPSTGIMADIFKALNAEPVFFLAEPELFPYLLVITDTWKGAGYGSIVYLAAITSIDPALYEAAIIDGASRTQQIFHITIPGMSTIIVLMATLSLGNVLNAGFDQVLNLYSPVVYSTGDIIDTFVYRIGMVNSQYGIATAAGLFKSLVSLVLISTGYYLARVTANYTIF